MVVAVRPVGVMEVPGDEIVRVVGMRYRFVTATVGVRVTRFVAAASVRGGAVRRIFL